MTKLLIISHTEHYKRDGQVVAWGATLREIDYLATLFDEVTHLAPMHQGEGKESSLPYQAKNVRYVPVPSAGGAGVMNKLRILLVYPQYILIMLRELARVDVVHIRCPANISLLAMLLITILPFPKKRWCKYAGNWKPGREPLSYTFQRWWLTKGLQRGKVTVNGEWDDQPAHVYSFLNPCLTDEEVKEGREQFQNKEMTAPIRLLFVGRLETPKGVGRILKVVKQLKANGVQVVADLVGDGSERPAFEQFVIDNDLSDCVVFHGWQARGALNPLYSQAHIMLFPSSSSEGWPKVLSEAMAYGVVPVTSTVSSIPYYLKKFQTGRSFPADDLQNFVEAITWYVHNPDVWKEEAHLAVDAAEKFSYTNYLQSVNQLLELS